jgi:restriction endonuclease S subunit
MGNIQDGRIDLSDVKWGDVPAGDAEALALDEGDILFNRTNSRDLVGKVALVREPTDCLYASYIVRLSVDRTVADPYYLFALMHSGRAQKAFKNIATPGVSQSNINPTNLKKQRFPLPNLTDQRAIVGQLRAIEDARLISQQQLEALQVIRKDLAANLLAGRIRVPA